MQIHIWPCAGRLNTGKMAPGSRLHRRRAQPRADGAAPLALSQKLHNSVFFCVPLAPPMLLSLSWNQGWVSVSESVYGPYKETSGFLATIHLTQMLVTLTDF